MEARIIEDQDGAEEEIPIQGCCHPKRTHYRFMGLMLMCFLGFGSYFCYDNPSALQDNFKQDLNMTTTRFVMLYSIYSWPNVVLCFIGGFLIDTIFGIRLGAVIFMGLALIGQATFALGVFANIFWVMLLGRFIFGIGCESLAVAQNSYAVLWFKGKELNMVFGLQLSFARLGSAVNFIVMEDVYNFVKQSYEGSSCLGIVLFLATFTCVGSMLCAIVLAIMDNHTENVMRRSEGSNPEVVRLMDIKDFKGVFWLIAFICVAYYLAIFPFIALGKVFFKREYHFSASDANNVNSLVYWISAIASPFMGFIIDKTGKNVSWVILSISITLISHWFLNFFIFNPYIDMTLMGLSYSMLASSLWPLIALVVPEHQLGTAYGIAQALQNLGLAVVSIVAGQIVDIYGYFWLEMFFIGWLWVSLIAAVIIWIVDNGLAGGFLNMTPHQRENYEKFSIMPSNSERDSLLPADEPDRSEDDFLYPQSDIHIRNRYLSRIGAPVHVLR